MGPSGPPTWGQHGAQTVLLAGMVFNFGKCKCLHTGPGNTGMNYEMGGTILTKTVKEKDLGVTMNANIESIRTMQNCSV